MVRILAYRRSVIPSRFETNLKPSGRFRCRFLKFGQNPLPSVENIFWWGGALFFFYTSFPFFVPLSVVFHLPHSTKILHLDFTNQELGDQFNGFSNPKNDNAFRYSTFKPYIKKLTLQEIEKFYLNCDFLVA
jgi:hypothetical protein